MRCSRRTVALVLGAWLVSGGSGWPVEAQGLTGQIGGSVVDSSNAALPGALVVVRNTGTAVTREVVADQQGLFVITNLFAGTYDLRVTLAGFSTYEQLGIPLSATERVSLPPIRLGVSTVETTVVVEATALRAQTQSGERSATITADEIPDVGLRGRDFLGLLQGMAGVIDTATRDAPGRESFLGIQINGLSDQFMNLSYDGVTSKVTGFGAGNYITPSLDSIGEVKVQTSNYQAEYGRAGGASVTVVTKSGSARFSGSGAYFKRHEAFNANSWDRRRTCDAAILQGATSSLCDKPRYRYDNSAFTLGGPVLVPGASFNRDRDTLFFFYSIDLMPRTDPFLVNSTMPSALERAGDFSQTRNNAGVLRHIRDPRLAPLACSVNSGGPGCFPENVIPQDRIHPVGRQMLALFPLPDAVLVGNPVTGGNYNYQFAGDTERLRRDQVLRVDWNIRSGTTFYSRLQWGREMNARGYRGHAVMDNVPFPLTRNAYDINTMGHVNTFIHTFTPSTVLEATVGTNYAVAKVTQLSQADADAASYLVQLPAHVPYFPEMNRLNVLPNMSFAGSNALPNTAGISFHSQFPSFSPNDMHNVSVNLTHLRGAHNLKAGIYLDRSVRAGRVASTGTYNFNSSSSNPLDTNFGWANALLGHLNSYSESSRAGLRDGLLDATFNQLEFYVQDNWRVTRRLTLDVGIRFTRMTPTSHSRVGYFDPDAWDPARAPQLWHPHCQGGVTPCSSSNRVARNPITGEVRASSWIGAVVEGTGDMANGTVVVDGYPPQYKAPGPLGLLPGPRVGFGWDVFGDGRTAVRGGYGTAFNRYGDGQLAGFNSTSPLQRTVTLNWTTIDDRFNTPSLDVPQGATALDRFKPITVHSWSLGVQRELPWRLLADVGYVGNRVHNGTAVNSNTAVPINDLNPLTMVTPAPDQIDPTTGNLYPTNFLRPYVGRAGISHRVWIPEHYRAYHAIQIEVRRRLANGLAGSVAYTGSKAWQFSGWDWYRTPEDNRDRHEHMSGSRPHNLTFTYNWLLPGASRFVGGHVIAQGVLDGWQLSGLTTMRGGTRSGFSTSFTGAPSGVDLTQGFGGSRPVVVCDPNLPRSERSFQRQFRTECVRPPGPLTDPSDVTYQGTGRGHGTVDSWTSLGYVNHDVTLMKNFGLGNRRNVQVRIEMYNALNSTQYQSVNTSAQFNYQTGEQTNTNFGTVTGVRSNSNRVMQLGVRFTF